MKHTITCSLLGSKSRQQVKLTQRRGFTLLEVLVALVVLSIGLIGLAGLQGSSLRFTNDAYVRSQATILAYEMADRVRANVDGDYHNPTKQLNTDCEDRSGTPSGCTVEQMVRHDMAWWTDERIATLPSAWGTICRYTNSATLACDPNGDDYVIRIRWDGNRDGSVNPDAPDPSETVVVTFRP